MPVPDNVDRRNLHEEIVKPGLYHAFIYHQEGLAFPWRWAIYAEEGFWQSKGSRQTLGGARLAVDEQWLWHGQHQPRKLTPRPESDDVEAPAS